MGGERGCECVWREGDEERNGKEEGGRESGQVWVRSKSGLGQDSYHHFSSLRLWNHV